MTRGAVIRRGVVCLLLGAVTTVAVAWGFAMFVPRGMGAGTTRYLRVEPTGLVRWTGRAMHRRAGAVRHEVWWNDLNRGVPSRLPPDETAVADVLPPWGVSVDAFGRFAHDAGAQRLEQYASGWPRPALWHARLATTAGPVDIGGIDVSGNPAPNAGRILAWHAALPLRPIASGLVIDTLVFAAFFALLLFAPPMLRERRRRRSGRCPGCGYDLRGNPAAGCPECGRGKEQAAAARVARRKCESAPGAHALP